MKNTKTNVGSFAAAKLQAKMRGILAILALMLVCGMTVVACGDLFDTPDDDDSSGISVPGQLVGEWYKLDSDRGPLKIASDGRMITPLTFGFDVLSTSTLGSTSGTIVFGYRGYIYTESGRFSYRLNGNRMTVSNSNYYDIPDGNYEKR